MVFGFIYSPPGSGPAATRLADSSGLTASPSCSAVRRPNTWSIHYDNEGWEDRVTYRDGKNLPAAGPDGASGKASAIIPAAEVIQLLSLDADGKNMIDNAGNCGPDRHLQRQRLDG